MNQLTVESYDLKTFTLPPGNGKIKTKRKADKEYGMVIIDDVTNLTGVPNLLTRVCRVSVETVKIKREMEGEGGK